MRISFLFVVALLISMTFGKKSEESSVSRFASNIFWGSVSAVGGVIVKEVSTLVKAKVFGSEEE